MGTGELAVRSGARAPIARFESAVAVVRGRMLVVGGHMDPELEATRSGFAYDVAGDRWSPISDAPLAISHVTAAVVDDRYMWIVGGYEGKHPGRGMRSTHRYDAVTDMWDSGPPLPEVRASGGLALVGRRLHYFGGVGADRVTNYEEHWSLDVDDPRAWEPHSPIPFARTHAATAVHEDNVYAIGGHFGHDRIPGREEEYSIADLDYVHRYVAEEDRWEEVAPLPRRRSHCEPGTFVYRGKIICIGGRNNSPDAVSRYEKVTLALQAKRALRKLRRALAPVESSALNDIVGYDPARDRWFNVGTLPKELYAPAATVVGDEVVVTNGGGHEWRDPSDETYRLTLDV